MSRPKKAESDKREQRLTLYLTQEEEEALEIVAGHLDTDKTKCVLRAISQWIQLLENPPEPITKAKLEKIMQSSREEVTGYICTNGHIFWQDWSWPSPPEQCPNCGSRHLKRTWQGVVRKGFGFKFEE